MKVGHFEFFVLSPQKSAHFYCDLLDFKIESDQGEKFKWIKSGDIEILLRIGISKPKTDSYYETNIALCLYCDNLNNVIEKLKTNKISFITIDNSDECIAIQDPDGNWIQIVNPKNK